MINLTKISTILLLCFSLISCVKDLKSNIEYGSASARISTSNNNTEPLFEELK